MPEIEETIMNWRIKNEIYRKKTILFEVGVSIRLAS
jgi:hypothetical protein